MRKKTAFQRVLMSAALVLLALWSVFPIFWNATTAIKSRADIFSMVPTFIFSPDWSALETAFSPGSSSVYKYLYNSLIISLGATLSTVVLGTMAAYVLSRYKFRFRGLIWFVILSTRLLPPISTAVPLFLMASSLQLVDTHFFLICLNIALNIPFSIWLLKSFFDSIPMEIQEASIVDGCNAFQSVRYIVLPLVAPGIATAATFVFIQVWNEYTFASIFSATKVRTLPVLIAESRGEDIFMWQDMAARSMIQMVPALLLGLYLQKHLVGGLTAGAVKG